MLKNACDTTLASNSGTLPDVQGAMLNWFQQVTFILIVKNTVNGQVIETPTEYSCRGIIQPVAGRDLLMKPEGQREWNWQSLWCFPDLVLSIDDRLTYLDITYRVMKKNDWQAHGYVSYELAEDYGT